MFFHEALLLVFTAFSRQVLQQGRLTAYLADCAVFDTFDDRRTICRTIDQRYGALLYACLSHLPYKQQFDAIVNEVKQLYPTIDPLQVDYVFQSIRFAWGKIQQIKVPPKRDLFTKQKNKKKVSSKQKKRRTKRNNPTPYNIVRPQPKPVKKFRTRTIRNHTIRRTAPMLQYPIHNGIHWKLLLQSIGIAVLQIVRYVVLVQCLVGGLVFLIEGRWYGLIGILLGVILLYVLYRKHNP